MIKSGFDWSVMSLGILATLILGKSLAFTQESAVQSETPLESNIPLPVQEAIDLQSSGRFFELFKLPRFVRRASVTPTLLAGGSTDGLDQMELSASASIMVPDLLFESGALLSITPSISVMNLDGPTGAELPNELNRVGTTFGWMKRPNEKVSYSLSVSPSAASDFQTDENVFRLTAHAMVSYQKSEKVQYVFGVAYLNRNDISLLPLAGMIWTPSEDFRVELSAPRPRIARRIQERSSRGTNMEDWVYLAGEFGGGTWAVERTNGVADELTIRDFRIVLGYENQSTGRLRTRAEIGHVFGRNLEYESDNFAFEPDGALMMRANVTY